MYGNSQFLPSKITPEMENVRHGTNHIACASSARDPTKKRILVPIDFSDPEMPPYFDFTEEQLNSAEKNLRALCDASKASASLPMRSTIRTGLAAHEIVEAAKELDSDLIIIATHGYTGWMHFCIGSTTERVVRTAPCPVFVVREKEHDFI